MKTDHVVILASASPRRQQLLREAGIAIEVHPAHIREELTIGETPVEYACRLAREKAQSVARLFPGRYVLGADTIVVIDKQVLEKPRNAADAARMLRMLSGRTHDVTTGVSLVDPAGETETRFATARVSFRELEDAEIRRYIETGEPMDKAGAYAVQGGAAAWVHSVEGEYSNVVGLPVSLVKEMLGQQGVALSPTSSPREGSAR